MCIKFDFVKWKFQHWIQTYRIIVYMKANNNFSNYKSLSHYHIFFIKRNQKSRSLPIESQNTSSRIAVENIVSIVGVNREGKLSKETVYHTKGKEIYILNVIFQLWNLQIFYWEHCTTFKQTKPSYGIYDRDSIRSWLDGYKIFNYFHILFLYHKFLKMIWSRFGSQSYNATHNMTVNSLISIIMGLWLLELWFSKRY